MLTLLFKIVKYFKIPLCYGAQIIQEIDFNTIPDKKNLFASFAHSHRVLRAQE